MMAFEIQGVTVCSRLAADEDVRTPFIGRSKNETPKLNVRIRAFLEVVIWNFSVAWSLEFGVWILAAPPRANAEFAFHEVG